MNGMKTFKEISAAAKERVKGLGPATMAVLAPSRDLHIQAVLKAAEEGYVKPLFIGDKNRISELASNAGLCVGDEDIIDSASPIEDAISMATSGRVRRY